MKFSLLALGVAATVYATEEAAPAGDVYEGPVIVPFGLAPPPRSVFKFGPPKCDDGEFGFAHPPHKVPIDDCEETHFDNWHFRPCKKDDHKHKPQFPPQKWTTSTDTVTKTKTIIECDDDVKECPDHPKTKYTTTTVEVSTTICPVPDTDAPAPTGTSDEKPPAPPAVTSEAEGDAPAPAPTAAEKPPAPPSEAPEADASSGPNPVVIAGAAKPAAGILGAVVALVAALL